MIHLILETHSPYVNLAAEEYLLCCGVSNYFMLWQNEPSVIIGCHQNAYAEVDTQQAERQGVKVVRRITGGGAVYHDLGNVNFSLIRNILPIEPDNPYDMLCQPIIETLKQCGVEAYFSGRNDLLADGRKIAGCATRRHKQRILIHGAMLYSTDLQCLASLLTPHSSKFEDKAVKSVSSRVANVQALMPQATPLEHFLSLWAENAIAFFGGSSGALTKAQIADIERLSRRYADPNWIYGKVTPFAYSKTGKTDAGTLQVSINFEGDKIKNLRIFGDYFGQGNIADLEQHFIGCEYRLPALRKALANVELEYYITNLSHEELLSLMI
jgi:lipoate-protein ligase A